jgi:hypothetical protein
MADHHRAAEATHRSLDRCDDILEAKFAQTRRRIIAQRARITFMQRPGGAWQLYPLSLNIRIQFSQLLVRTPGIKGATDRPVAPD